MINISDTLYLTEQAINAMPEHPGECPLHEHIEYYERLLCWYKHNSPEDDDTNYDYWSSAIESVESFLHVLRTLEALEAVTMV
jgi:hypothetical protein